MWIVMYVAMIASLSAMGMLPVAQYRDQLLGIATRAGVQGLRRDQAQQ